MSEYFLCRLVETNGRFRSAVSRHITRPDSWADFEPRISGGRGFILSEVFAPTDAERAALVADPDIIPVDLANVNLPGFNRSGLNLEGKELIKAVLIDPARWPGG